MKRNARTNVAEEDVVSATGTAAENLIHYNTNIEQWGLSVSRRHQIGNGCRSENNFFFLSKKIIITLFVACRFDLARRPDTFARTHTYYILCTFYNYNNVHVCVRVCVGRQLRASIVYYNYARVV